jgi:methyl-accepting chemotaxis protein
LITRLSVGVSMMVFCALNIHQAYGMTELHFGIFVLLAFLVFYQDWRVIVAAAVVVALHHLSFNQLQELGYGTMCLTQPRLGIIVSISRTRREYGHFVKQTTNRTLAN